MGVLCLCCVCVVFFFFKQKTAYEMRISDWSSDVCSADLDGGDADGPAAHGTGIIDQQRDHRVTEFRIALALVGKAMSGVYHYPGKPGRIEQTFFLIEIPGAGL